MKIGIFTETYHPTVNGVVVSVDTFKNQLEKRGHEYVIFAPEAKEKTKSLPHVYRFPSIEVPKIYPLAVPMPYAMARRHFNEKAVKDLDIIHIQHYSAMGQYGLSLAHELGIPAVYTYHTMAELYTHYIPVVGPFTKGPVRSWTRHTAARATHVITPTQSVRRYLRSIGVEQPISIIPTGIHTKEYSRASKAHLEKAYQIPPKSHILLYAGRLAPEKNVMFLLEAFRQVHLAEPAAHLVLAGDGPQKQECVDFVQKFGLASNVTFIGFVKHDEMLRLFGAADLFVFPSTTDTQAIVIVEAMAAGAVPVAIDRYGPHDIIKDKLTGRLVDLNLEKFSATIINLLHDEAERHQLAIAARHAAKQYDVSVTADAMEELYERLTSHSRS